MTVVFPSLKTGLLDSSLNLVTDTLKGILVMADSTVLADYATAVFVADLVNLDEADGAGYARVAIAGRSTALDPSTSLVNIATLLAGDLVFPGLGAGSRPYIGVLLMKQGTTDADSPALVFYDGAGFPVVGTGADLTVYIPPLADLPDPTDPVGYGLIQIA